MNFRFFSQDELDTLNPNFLPTHVAIIPDGNRRWAKKRELNPSKGHEKSANSFADIVCAAKDLGIKTVTFYLFSTENWSRSQEEIDALMFLLHVFLTDQLPIMLREGIRMETIGDVSRLPPFVVDSIHQTKSETAHCNSINMVLALNYGARDEMRRAVTSIAEKVSVGTLAPHEITEAIIADNLDTAPYGDPQLLIRTSGELRLSNFLLWQLSYAEVYISEVLWPDFKPVHLYQAILDYQKRERRLGGL